MKSSKPDKNNRLQTTSIGGQIKKYLDENFYGFSEGIKEFVDKTIFHLEQKNISLQQENDRLQEENQNLQEGYRHLHAEKDEITRRFDTLANEYRRNKTAESGDITFDSIKLGEQFADFKTQKFNAFVAQIQNMNPPDHNQENKAEKKSAIKEILTRNIFLKMNSSSIDIIHDIYKELVWENPESWEAPKLDIQNFISECHELVRKAWCMTPPGKIFVYREGTPFDPGFHEVAPSYKESGTITATLFPACLIESKILVKALVLTEPEDFSVEEDALTPDQEETVTHNQEKIVTPDQEEIVTHNQEEAGEEGPTNTVDLPQPPVTSATQTQPEETRQPAPPEETRGDQSAPVSETRSKKLAREGSTGNPVPQASSENEEGQP